MHRKCDRWAKFFRCNSMENVWQATALRTSDELQCNQIIFALKSLESSKCCNSKVLRDRTKVQRQICALLPEEPFQTIICIKSQNRFYTGFFKQGVVKESGNGLNSASRGSFGRFPAI